MLLESKVALVTGGSSGIGRATAFALARQGARVLIADVDDAGGQATQARIEADGGHAAYIHTDVTEAAAVAKMVDAAVERFGSLDIAVNNAGISGNHIKPLHECDEALYDAIMDVNVRGVWLCLKYEIPAIKSQGSGSIINVASVAGLLGFNGGSIYAASKHAVIGLTKSAALELAREGVRVNAVCPSYVDTPMVTNIILQNPQMAKYTPKASPMRRLAKAGEIAESIVWLASERASFVNGLAFAIDGGLTAM